MCAPGGAVSRLTRPAKTKSKTVGVSGLLID